MTPDRQPSLVICISPGIRGRWDVSEKGCEEPLASFDEKEDAYAYADELKKTNAAATVLVEDKEGFFPMPPLARAAADWCAQRRADAAHAPVFVSRPCHVQRRSGDEPNLR